MPHSATLLLFTTSAQTHIFPEIRIDAIKFIDVFLKCIPDIVTLGWDDIGGERHGHRVLGGYLGILNAGAKYVEADGKSPCSCGGGGAFKLTLEHRSTPGHIVAWYDAVPCGKLSTSIWENEMLIPLVKACGAPIISDILGACSIGQWEGKSISPGAIAPTTAGCLVHARCFPISGGP